MNRKDLLIETLQLAPHPEGGFYKETYRSAKKIRKVDQAGDTGVRASSTAIYYLLGGGDISRFHRLKSDEVWHHYEGSPATIHLITPEGDYQRLRLGKNIEDGERPQLTVSGGNWFAVTVNEPGGFLLAGCTVAPGFEFEDFEMADREQMLRSYPDHEELLNRLCR